MLILVGRGSSKRAAIKKLYEKTHNIVLIYSDLISPEELNKHCIVKAKNITEEASQPSLLYFEGVNHKVLMAVERIIFGDMQMREIFF